MNEKKSLLKTFLVFGIAMLGSLYVFSVELMHASFSNLLGYEFGIGWFYLKIAVISLICCASIMWVIRLLWIAGNREEGRSFWVYPAIGFIVFISLSLCLVGFSVN